jgi:Domain of unknown function (DUF4337)
MSHGVASGEGGNKKIAMLISVMALILALSEALGKAAQTSGLTQDVDASNLWNFYQAKTIRQTTLRTAIENAEARISGPLPAEEKAALDKRISAWRETVSRYESEPSTREGRRELMARAKDAEGHRDRALAAYHQYEIAAAAVQIGIVLASAEIITGVAFLVWFAVGLGVVGLAFSAIGFFAPLAVHIL